MFTLCFLLFTANGGLPESLEWKGRAVVYGLPHLTYYAAAIRNTVYSKIRFIKFYVVMIRYRVFIGLSVCVLFALYVRDREIQMRAQFARLWAISRDGLASTKAFLLVSIEDP